MRDASYSLCPSDDVTPNNQLHNYVLWSFSLADVPSYETAETSFFPTIDGQIRRTSPRKRHRPAAVVAESHGEAAVPSGFAYSEDDARGSGGPSSAESPDPNRESRTTREKVHIQLVAK